MKCPVSCFPLGGDLMRRTQLLQELRKMRFEEAYWGWQEKRLDQEEAACLLGVCARTFRRECGAIRRIYPTAACFSRAAQGFAS